MCSQAVRFKIATAHDVTIQLFKSFAKCVVAGYARYIPPESEDTRNVESMFMVMLSALN